MIGGYTRKTLRVDLANNQITIQRFNEDILRKYIGGSGLAAKIVIDETDENTDPLGPDNVLAIMTGPFAGAGVPNCGRHHAAAKSPQNGALGEGNSGGTWGQKLKYAGWDGIIFNGASKQPVYLFIENETVNILSADECWGMDTFEFDDFMKERHGKKAVTLAIGQAGENLCNCAALMNDGYDGRTVGRCGLGAVMGSKKVKGVVVIGISRPPVIDKAAMKEVTKKYSRIAHESMQPIVGEFGTSCGVATVEELGDLPIKNWQLGNFTVDKITGQYMAKTILKKQYYCAQCPIGCGRTVEITEGKYANGVVSGGPEYETLGLLGANLMLNDMNAVQYSNELCNRFGMDTIATGNIVAFAMEAYENDVLTQDMLGCKARWGNPDDVHEIIRKIAYREGVGDILANGTQKASQILGGIAPEMAVTVKGMEFPAHDPRAMSSVALSYATSTRGACHLNSFTGDFSGGGYCTGFGVLEEQDFDRFASEEKDIQFVIDMQHLMAMCDSMSCCKFMLHGLSTDFFDMIQQAFKYVIGWDISKEEFLTTGERIFNLKRVYQNKCGITRKDDVLPSRMSLRRGTGGAADYIPPVVQMLDRYYEIRGWDKYGMPDQETLKRLGMQQYYCKK